MGLFFYAGTSVSKLRKFLSLLISHLPLQGNQGIRHLRNGFRFNFSVLVGVLPQGAEAIRSIFVGSV